MSRVTAQSEIIIKAPIEAVWKLFAEEFAEIGKWSSSVDQSVGSGEGINGAEVAERACVISTTGFSDTKERILQYDRHQVLRYSLYDGLPGFVENAENTWSFYKDSATSTKVTGQTDMRVGGIMGFLARGIMKRNLKRVLAQMATEAKYYIENGTPHPDKLEAMARYERKQAKIRQRQRIA